MARFWLCGARHPRVELLFALLTVIPFDLVSSLNIHGKLSKNTRPQTRRSHRQSIYEFAESWSGQQQRQTSSNQHLPKVSEEDEFPILLIPSKFWNENIIFTQRSTSHQCHGKNEVELAEQSFSRGLWESEELAGCTTSMSIGPVTPPLILSSSSKSNVEVCVRWNVTWVPPTAAWLWNMGTTLPGIEPDLIPYNHRSGEISTFRWSSVIRLFRDAIFVGKLKVPLACIEGRTTLRFSDHNDNNVMNALKNDDIHEKKWLLESIAEDLVYADELRRASLCNRKCAQDLRLFLEVGRRPPHVSAADWADIVSESLPWSTVPGSQLLDIEPPDESEGNVPAIIFLLVAAIIMTVFAHFMTSVLLLDGPVLSQVSQSTF